MPWPQVLGHSLLVQHAQFTHRAKMHSLCFCLLRDWANWSRYYVWSIWQTKKGYRSTVILNPVFEHPHITSLCFSNQQYRIYASCCHGPWAFLSYFYCGRLLLLPRERVRKFRTDSSATHLADSRNNGLGLRVIGTLTCIKCRWQSMLPILCWCFRSSIVIYFVLYLHCHSWSSTL